MALKAVGYALSLRSRRIGAYIEHSTRRNIMARLTFKAALAGIALTGLFAATVLPNAAQASSRKDALYHPLVVKDQLGIGRADTTLGFKTHWECSTDISNTSDPWTCVRVKDVVSETTTVGQRLGQLYRVGYVPTGLTRHRPATLGSQTCNQNGGIKLWQDAGFQNNCGMFTGHGSINLQGLPWPGLGGTNVGASVSSLSTAGSATANGSMSCTGGSPLYFGPGQNYSSLPSDCNDRGQALTNN